MDGIETILTRRSIRAYDGRAVPEDIVNTLLRAGMYAPSAKNSQPWEFIVIRDVEKRKATSETGPFWRMLKDAPLGIMVLANLEKLSFREMYVQDCAAATENILLAAQALGLGGVWLGLYPIEERIKPVREIFNIPENVIPISLISIGYPAEKKEPHTEFHKEKVHYDKY